MSKITLVDFYYGHIVKVFKDINLIATDTDSLMIQVTPKNPNNESLNIYGLTSDPYFVVNDVCNLININRTSNLVKRIVKE